MLLIDLLAYRLSEKRCAVFNFRHKNSGQCFTSMKHRPLCPLFSFLCQQAIYRLFWGFYQLSTDLSGGRFLPFFLPKIFILMLFRKQRCYAVFSVSTLKNADFAAIR